MERFFPVNGLLSGSLSLFKLLENNLVVVILIDLIDRFVDVCNNIINLKLKLFPIFLHHFFLKNISATGSFEHILLTVAPDGECRPKPLINVLLRALFHFPHRLSERILTENLSSLLNKLEFILHLGW